jgi:hypothetical protein
MNTYFLFLLQSERKRKVLGVIEEFNLFPLFSGKFEGEIHHGIKPEEIKSSIIISSYKLGFTKTDKRTHMEWYFNPCCNHKRCWNWEVYFELKAHSIREINKYNFRGKNIFLRLDESFFINLISFLKF